MKDTIPDDVLSKISIHPTGSTRSKIVKDVDVSHAMSIARKLDSKSFKGRLLHCRPHVPLSPPKTQNNPTKSIEIKTLEEPSKAVTAETDEPVDIESKSQNPLIVEEQQSIIPGLLQKEVDQATKKQENKKKKQERRKQRVENKDKETKSPLDFTNIADLFEFDDASEEATFEDSVEDVNEFLTPKPFKSDFAKKVEAKLTPVPTPKRAASFADLSPIEPTESKKSKSVKPRKLGKSSLPCAPGRK